MEVLLAEIRAFGFKFAPAGWAFANGASLPVSQNSALYALIGNQYGGNQIKFLLPDLQGRVAIGMGGTYPIGSAGGAEAVVLAPSTLPTHTHGVPATPQAANVDSSQGAILAATASGHPLYGTPAKLVDLNLSMVSSVGGGKAHPNMQPFLALNYCISMSGNWPSRY